MSNFFFMCNYSTGLSPEHLSGQKVGVFIGTCFSETEKAFVYNCTLGGGLGVTGYNIFTLTSFYTNY